MVKFVGYHNPATYASLPCLDESKQQFESVSPEVLKDIGKVLIDHKVEDKYGLGLMHKHFELDDKEVLVEALSGSKAVSFPWTISASNPEPIDKQFCDSYAFPRKEYIRAHAWKFLANGQLSSYEYFQDVEAGEEPPTEFVSDLYLKLKEYGLEDVLGLRLQHYGKEVKGFETTDDINRANILELMPKNKPFDETVQTIETFWMFDTDPNGMVQFGCFYVCIGVGGNHASRHW